MGQCRIHWLFQALSASHYKQRLRLNIQRQSAICNPFSLSPDKCPQTFSDVLKYNLEKNFVVTVTNNIHNLAVTAKYWCHSHIHGWCRQVAITAEAILYFAFILYNATFVKKSGWTCPVLSCSNNSGKLQLWRKLNGKYTSLYDFITVCWGSRGSLKVDQEVLLMKSWNARIFFFWQMTWLLFWGLNILRHS